MKIEPRRIAAFLRDPGIVRCVLFYGDDVGAIRERAETIARTVVADLDDPFRAATLDRENHARLAEEASALALTGGRRVVRVRDVTDTLTAPLKQILEGKSEALIVLEAPDLSSKSKLRALLDKSPDAATIGCYPEEGRSLDATIRAGLQAEGVSADNDAVQYLARHLGADRALTAGEITKLALYVGLKGHVDLAAAQACVGDAAALSIDDALHAATAGDMVMTDRAVGLALSEGAASVGLLRAAQSHLQRLHRARLSMANGMNPEEAAKSLRPPVFFKRMDAFTRALTLWPAPILLRAMQALNTAERSCKRTGAPDEAICRDALANLARYAQSRRQRR